MTLNKNYKKLLTCQICKKQMKPSEVIPAEFVSKPVFDTIKQSYPGWTSDGYICLSDINHFRSQHVKNVLETEKGELSNLENQVMKSLEQHEILSRNINEEFEQKLTVGENLQINLQQGPEVGNLLLASLYFLSCGS